MTDDKRDKERVSIAQTIRQLKEEMVMRIELEQTLAKLTKAKFDALVREGFTPEQAIQLCKVG